MTRNKLPLLTQAHAAQAAMQVVNVTKALSLSKEAFISMFLVDVEAKLASQALQPYVQGLRDAYQTMIMTECCEFVYRDPNGKFYGMDTAPKARYPHYNHLFAKFTKTQQCTCGWLWKGTDIPFTEFDKPFGESSVTPKGVSLQPGRRKASVGVR